MEFIIENYLVIILLGLFFVFALIGYLIDMFRKNNDDSKEEISNIKPVEVTELNLPKNESLKELVETNSKKDDNDADELLKNYDESINE